MFQKSANKDQNFRKHTSQKYKIKLVRSQLLGLGERNGKILFTVYSVCMRQKTIVPCHHGVTEGSVTVLGWFHPTGPSPGMAEAIELNATRAVVRPAEECQRVGPQDLVQPQDQLCMMPSPPLNDLCSVSRPSSHVIGLILIG